MRGHIGVASFVVFLLIEEFIKEPTYSGRGGGTAGIAGEIDGWGLHCVAIKPPRPMQFLFVFSLLNLSRA
jgi:hypothetical protein